MRNCLVRININFDVYIEENAPVILLSEVIDKIIIPKNTPYRVN